ncbi:LGFP repeat-containing protein [Kineococcus arenarius]|uniref:LGFP repeat-containing protein n=1 Tax=unclassified Kineococcus TaxID=2621656 RepID=UPI003D7E8A99
MRTSTRSTTGERARGGTRRGGAAATSVLGAAVAATLLGAPPASAEVRDLDVRASCVQGLPGHLVTFTSDGTVTDVRLPSGELSAVEPGRGSRAVNFRLTDGQGGVFQLLDATGGVVAASAPVGSYGCDGWPSVERYLAEGDDLPGSPQALTGLSPTPSATTAQGVVVHRAADGALYLDPRSGGHVVRGAIHDLHLADGGTSGWLGHPLTSEFGVSTLDGLYTRFEGGTVYWSAFAGAHAVRGAIAAGYAARDYERGTGLPLTDEFGPLLRGGFGQHFTGGSLFWSPDSGVWRVRGAIRDEYARLGWDRSVLGYPVSDEDDAGRGGFAQVQHFQGGSIYSSDRSGAHAVRGAIRDAYDRAGRESGYLVMPVAGEVALPDGGAFQRFEYGSIYRGPRTGAHYVLQARGVLDRWGELGWERGIGYPTSDPFIQLRDGWSAQHFERGSLYTRSYVEDPRPVLLVKGAIRDHWASAGWENSRFGYPTGEEVPVPGGVRQDFEHGSLTYTWATGQVTAG